MSLRLKLALAIATIAGLVAGGTGVLLYSQEKADRYDRARKSTAQVARLFTETYDNGQGVSAQAIFEPVGGPFSAEVPTYLRNRLTTGHVFSVIVRSHGQPVVIAGARAKDGANVYAVHPFAADVQALADLRVSLLQICIGAACVGAALGLIASIALGRPLRRSAALARRLAAGDLEARLEPKGHDEIAQLGQALDDMAESLGAQLRALDEAAEREKRFSGDVAHELRTPVTGLVAAAALLDDSRPARMVRERAAALAALVEDLLEVMRLESASETAHLDPVPLVRLVRDVVASRLPEAEIDAPADLEVVSDARRIERILVNLLENARRHGRAPYLVGVSVDGSGAAVTVRDSGDGFGAFLPHAGERFALAAPERGRGTGLGLAICRGQARVIGGTVELVDDGGAVATLRLPGPVGATPRLAEALS
jgi:signal transduction histidine kinase